MIRYEDLLEARDHLHPEIMRTPLQTWRYASSRLGCEVKIKLETLQRTGSFKARGAWNFLRRLRPAERRAGVICCSAGNHAQGVALACSLLGVQATVVMPETSPEIKILQTRLYGEPEIILHGESIQDALELAREIGAARGLVFVHPFDDDAVIAGQGTVGLEILEQWPDVDTIVVPVGGGGLAAGLAIAALTHHEDIEVIGVQAERAAAAVRSLAEGRRLRLPFRPTIADGINVSQVGERPFAILQRHGVRMLEVSEEEIGIAVSTLCQTAKLVVEPAGAAAAAAVLFRRGELAASHRVACILSGANVTIDSFVATLQSHPRVPE